jgi:hypothetical protein
MLYEAYSKHNICLLNFGWNPLQKEPLDNWV